MGNMINLDDHRILKFQAAEEGLDYRDFRAKLRLHDIQLEEAIENARRGISVGECLRERERTNRRFKYFITGAMVVSLIALLYSAISDGTTRNERYRDQVNSTEYIMLTGT